MWNNTIASRVNRVIKQRIKVAQEKHDKRVEEIEEEREAALLAVNDEKDTEIEVSANSLVDEIIGKK